MDTSYSQIVRRMMESTGLKNESAVAKVLGVTPQALSNYKKRGKMPPNLVLKFAFMYGLSVDWLLTGKGGMRIEEKGAVATAREEPAPYAAELKGADISQMTPDELIYVGKLLKVLQKGSPSIVGAVKFSIDAFLKAVETKEKSKSQ
ncbi:MAG TPA: hypothetical protein ENK42_03410 [Deltaproteobacteria bacterium]|nr:hypothetical protein [Deltaproteobacteria bacterium]